MSKTTDTFVEQNRDRLLDELKEFLRIPSISTLPEHRDDIERAARFVADSLRHVGMENVEIIPTAKHPLVYADWMHAPGKPTVLCYATTTCSRPIRWKNGTARPSSRPCATATSMDAAPRTIKARCTCT